MPDEPQHHRLYEWVALALLGVVGCIVVAAAVVSAAADAGGGLEAVGVMCVGLGVPPYLAWLTWLAVRSVRAWRRRRDTQFGEREEDLW